MMAMATRMKTKSKMTTRTMMVVLATTRSIGPRDPRQDEHVEDFSPCSGLGRCGSGLLVQALSQSLSI